MSSETEPKLVSSVSSEFNRLEAPDAGLPVAVLPSVEEDNSFVSELGLPLLNARAL